MKSGQGSGTVEHEYNTVSRSHQNKKMTEHAYYFGTRFKGKCHWCGKIGHKSTECRQRLTGKPKTNVDEGEHKGKTNFLSKQNGFKFTNRKNISCTHCNKQGHEDECRFKKPNNASHDSANVVKELALMVKQLQPNDENQFKVETCTGCGRWGPAFTYCMHCG
jgi:hypothetical protein